MMKGFALWLSSMDENVHEFIMYLGLTSQKLLFNFNGFLVVHKHITIYNFKVQGLPFVFKYFIFES
jgi:hypothetical protein